MSFERDLQKTQDKILTYNPQITDDDFEIGKLSRTNANDLTALKVPLLCAFKLLPLKPSRQCVGGNLDGVMHAVWINFAVIFHQRIWQWQQRKEQD